jgi:DNA polymerase III epsilon subunit-like protein
MTRPLVFLDTETTGLIPGHHEIIEICMVKHEHEVAARIECPERKSQVYNLFLPMFPERIDPRAAEINGFDMTDWLARGAIEFHEGIDEIVAYMEDCTVVGFNPWFDLRFIAASALGREMKMNYHALDLCSMAYPLKAAGIINSVSAKAICEFFEIDYSNAHRACDDVELSIECYRRLLDYIQVGVG